MRYQALKTSVILLFTFFIPVTFLTPGSASAVSFSADMVMHMEGKTTKSKFYLLNHQYRYDTVEDGKRLRVIVDRRAGKTRIFDFGQRAYFEVANNDMQSLLNNPFEAHFYMTTLYDVTSEGEERIGGILCGKKVLTMQGQKVQTAWIAEKYQFPIKLINYKGKKQHMLVELINIKENPLGTEFFKPPHGFQLVKTEQIRKEQMSLPKWLKEVVKKVPKALVLTPSFERRMAAGDMIRVKFREGMVVSFKATGDNLVEYIAFREGRFIKVLGTFGGRAEARFSSLPDGADEIVVLAKKGRFTLRAKLIE